MTNGLC